MPAHISLKVVAGPLSGAETRFDEPTVAIAGRSRECNVRLPNDEAHGAVSRMHCFMDVNPPSLRVRDFGSRNGTFVNGRMIGKREKTQSIQEGRKLTFPEIDVKDGDKIQIGTTIYEVRIQVPLACVACGREASPEEMKQAGLQAGAPRDAGTERRKAVWRCAPCKEKALSGSLVIDGALDEQRSCARCGAPTRAAEDDHLRRGEVVCEKCRDDKDAVLKDVLLAASTALDAAEVDAALAQAAGAKAASAKAAPPPRPSEAPEMPHAPAPGARAGDASSRYPRSGKTPAKQPPPPVLPPVEPAPPPVKQPSAGAKPAPAAAAPAKEAPAGAKQDRPPGQEPAPSRQQAQAPPRDRTSRLSGEGTGRSRAAPPPPPPIDPSLSPLEAVFEMEARAQEAQARGREAPDESGGFEESSAGGDGGGVSPPRQESGPLAQDAPAGSAPAHPFPSAEYAELELVPDEPARPALPTPVDPFGDFADAPPTVRRRAITVEDAPGMELVLDDEPPARPLREQEQDPPRALAPDLSDPFAVLAAAKTVQLSPDEVRAHAAAHAPKPTASDDAPADRSGAAQDRSGATPADRSGAAPADRSGTTPADRSGAAPADRSESGHSAIVGDPATYAPRRGPTPARRMIGFFDDPSAAPSVPRPAPRVDPAYAPDPAPASPAVAPPPAESSPVASPPVVSSPSPVVSSPSPAASSPASPPPTRLPARPVAPAGPVRAGGASGRGPMSAPAGYLGTFAGYQLLRRLAADETGGLGDGYVARMGATGDEVEVRVILPRVAVSEAARKSFLDDLTQLKTLTHPNLQQVLSFGHVVGAFYLVYERGRGLSAEALVRARGSLGVADATDIALQSLDALGYVHERAKTTHRDVSPRTVRVARSDLDESPQPGGSGGGFPLPGRSMPRTETGEMPFGVERLVKLADCGLARAYRKAGLADPSMTGDCVGTPAFMPRQQLLNFKEARPAFDVWALAATLYYLLTKSYPREYAKDGDAWKVTLTEPPVPILSRRKDVPPRLAQVLDEALDDRKELKHESAAALAGLLREGLW